jgi:hypothetical protein
MFILFPLDFYEVKKRFDGHNNYLERRSLDLPIATEPLVQLINDPIKVCLGERIDVIMQARKNDSGNEFEHKPSRFKL